MYSSEDHAIGLELQLIELVERRERALVQHRDAAAAAYQRDIDALQMELADLADSAPRTAAPAPEFHDARPVEPPSPAA